MERDFLGISPLVGKQKFSRNDSGVFSLPNNISGLQQFMACEASSSKDERLGPPSTNILDQFSWPSSIRQPYLQQNTGTGMIPSHQSKTLQLAAPRNSPTAQLTVFYGGSIYVYDKIPADKVQEMIELANKCSKMAEKPLQDFNKIVSETACSGFSSLLSAHSTNGSTTADHTNRQKISTTCDVTVSDRTINPPMPMSRAVPLARKASLVKFLEKRKERMINTENAPYLNAKLGGKVGGRWGEKPKPGLQINGEQNEKDLRDLEIFNAEKFETKSTMLLPSFSLG
ncbi:hypothetical protein ZOSMA_121G00720 [Zostera marina]|uniref:Protein TIFY n=1 Tax=Zostera marina TaxID=29655 RepID=A0A0K9Q0P6_ZOSMR|nr:hypothetical protein ZOSMA_121G00720 [Zostera marina]